MVSLIFEPEELSSIRRPSSRTESPGSARSASDIPFFRANPEAVTGASRDVDVGVPHEARLGVLRHRGWPCVVMARCPAFLGRRWGWVVVVSAFLMYLISCGSLGVFVLLFIYFQREFQDTAVAIGWIGSLANGLLNLMSFVTSPLYERFSHRRVIALGVCLSCVGLVATSFTQALWQNYLTFGVVFGIGLNFISCPSMNLMTVYFPGRNCARATAFANSGQSIGNLLLSPLAETVFSLIGWRRSLQILGTVVLVTCLPLAMVFTPPAPDTPDEGADGQSQKTPTVMYRKVDGKLAKSDATEEEEEEEDDEELHARLEIEVQSGRESSRLKENETEEEEEKGTGSSAADPPPSVADSPAASTWHKYLRLAQEPRHACFFLGSVGASVSITFNAINLMSCMTRGGIAESTAAWLVTVLYVSDVLFRFLLAVLGDALPVPSILLTVMASVLGAAASFLLTRGTSLGIFVTYCLITGFVRAAIYGYCCACVVQLFGAERSVESLASVQIAFGIGGLVASSVAGLSYDLTGTYQTTHYTCMGLWLLTLVSYTAVYTWNRMAPRRFACGSFDARSIIGVQNTKQSSH